MRESPDQLYTIEGAARLLALSRRTVARALADGAATRGAAGLWPAYRFGRAVRVPLRAIERYKARNLAPAIGGPA